MKKRELWVDILRGMAMFFVVMGHIYKLSPLYFFITGPIKMPMFYVLAGYVFKTDKKFIQFFKDSSFRLGIPWIIFSLFPLRLIKQFYTGGSGAGLLYALEFFTGKTQWFITSFFITQFLTLLIHKLFKNKNIAIWVVSLLLFTIGVLTAQGPVFNLWNINTALTGVLFMNVGYYMKRHMNLIDKHSFTITLYGGLLWVFIMAVSWVVYPNCSMDFHNVIYYNVPLCVCQCVLGILVLVCLAKKIRDGIVSQKLAVFGQSTIVVYLIHPTLMGIIRRVFGAGFLPETSATFINGLCATVMICIAATIISVVCEKIIPWSVGKKTDKLINFDVLKRNSQCK